MNDSTADDALARWHRAHAAASMVGWDFSRLDGRMTADEPWWDFERDCRKALATSSSALDLGTGGGERLIQLLEQTPERGVVHATEGWAPNVEVARANLAPLGVEVRPYDAEAGDRLPYDDGSMDLVMTRHEAIDPAEVARVLTPGGRLHFWTDVEEYFHTALETLREQTQLSGPHEVQEKPADHDLDYRTHFERRMRLHGHSVYRAEFEKTVIT